MYKDPVWYYFIVPVVVIVLRLMMLIVYFKLKAMAVARYAQFVNHFKPEEQHFRMPTQKESQMQAEHNRRQRIIGNHDKLVGYGGEQDD